MKGPPDFDELMTEIESSEERERLRRVHALLLDVDPPPELSPALRAPPAPTENRWLPWGGGRRVALAFALGCAVLAATFGGGYLAGESRSDGDEVAISDTVALRSESGASGVVNLGFRGRDGNWPMLVSVRGLPPLSGGDYYTLALTKNGKPVVTCGTFNVASRDRETIRMTAAYNLARFDGWVVLRYDAQTHKDTPVLWTGEKISA